MKNIQEAINKNKMKKVAKALSTVARKDKKVRFIQDQLNSGILPKKEIMNLKGSVQDEVVMAFVQEVGPDDMIKALNIKLKEQIAVEACWDGYKQAGMKKKKGKMVPNCVPEEKVGAECSCCGNKINKEGKCGCGSDCEHCGGQHDIKEAKYAVDVEGMPRFYVDADSPGKVKVALRKLLKRDSMIKDIERSTDSKVKQDYRQRISQESVEEGKWFVRQSAKPNKTGTYQGKKFDDGKKAIAQARKDWKLTPDEHMSAKMMKEDVNVEIFEGVEMNEQFVVKYAKSKRGIIYQAKFKTQPEAEKFLAQKRKEGMNGIVSKAGKPVSMQKMKDMQKESVELEEKMNTIDIARNVVKNKSAKHGLDMQTANLILQVYGKVNDKNKRKMEVMAPSALGQAVWKMTK